MAVHARYPHVEMSDHEFERLLDLVDALDPVQLLRLQCKVDAVLSEREVPGLPVGRTDRDTRPPPSGLSGPYAGGLPKGDTYEELDFDWEKEPTDAGV